MEELKKIISSCDQKMNKAIEHFEKELMKIKAGKATPTMLDRVRVEYYGTPTPLSQVANVNAVDSKTIVVQAWDKSILNIIEKAIRDSDLGLNPMNNGEALIINVPPLTEERRQKLMKQCREEGETAKIAVRNIRKDANSEAKKQKDNGCAEDIIKVGEADIQKHTDRYIALIDEILSKKEKEITSI